MANIVYNNNFKGGKDLTDSIQQVISDYKERGIWTGAVGGGCLENWVSSKRPAIEFED